MCQSSTRSFKGKIISKIEQLVIKTIQIKKTA